MLYFEMVVKQKRFTSHTSKNSKVVSKLLKSLSCEDTIILPDVHLILI